MTTPSRRDSFTAAALAAAVLAVYIRTLAPGLVAIIDTPVFQFVGRVLGVPHNPGYPGYVLLTHVYSYLPVGSLAYRMNLFSALLGATTAALVYCVSRQLGARRSLAAAAAIGLGCGRVFWSQAIIAEVYTLNAALVIGIIASLLAWARTRRPAGFYAAVVLLGIGLGNHTTIILLVPGMVAMALMTDARFSLRPATIGFVVLVAIATLAQYGFILLRSHTPGAYVESPARTIPELVDVIRGKQFVDGLFVFPLRDVIVHRIPFLTTAVLIPELSIAGLVLALLGLWHLGRTRPPQAWLLGSAAVLTFLFAVNYDVVDIPVFVIPVFVCLWPCAAVGVEVVLARLTPRVSTIAAIVLLPSVVAWQVARNYYVVDESHDRQAAVYFSRLFEGLPDRTTFVHEDFLVDRMVMYELLGAHAADGRQIRTELLDRDRVLADVARGETVLAFPKAADRLRDAGVDVSFEPRRVTGEPLRNALRDLPRGWTAVTGDAVAVAGRELVRTTEGVAVATVAPDGSVGDVYVAESADGLRVPLSPAGLQVFRVLGPHPTSSDHTQLLHRVDRRSDVVGMARDDQVVLFGDGWDPPAADRAGAYRRISGSRAVLTLPMRREAARLHIVAAAGSGGASVTLSLNGRSIDRRTLRPGWDVSDWLLPSGISRPGDNRLEFDIDPRGALTVSAILVVYPN